MKIEENLIYNEYPTLTENSSLQEVAELLVADDIHGIIILSKDNEVKGIISEFDVINASIPNYMKQMDDLSFIDSFAPFYNNLKKLLKDKKASDLMNVPTCLKKDTNLLQAAFLMVKKNFVVIPILDENNKYLGVITRDTILGVALKGAVSKVNTMQTGILSIDETALKKELDETGAFKADETTLDI